jgi:hypothetical protein
VTLAGVVERDVEDRRRAAWSFWITVASLFGLFLTYSLVQANIPGVNEPHYLTKSRHVWDSTWCAGDLFLESSNPHLVFYRTVGLLAAWFPFPVAALMGRILAYGLLAFAWTRLAITFTRSSVAAILSAAIFLLIATLGNWSGEWLVGGVESKVFAYGFAFWATSSLFEGRLRSAAILLGFAVSMHPVVGAWFVVVLSAAGMLHHTAWVPVPAVAGYRLSRWVLAGVLFLAAALPGLIPACALLGAGTPELSLEATRYQVLSRLSHHLNPFEFSARAYGHIAALLVATVVLAIAAKRSTRPAMRSFQVAVAASVAIAVCGIVIAVGLPDVDLSVKLLKFYPFRLADVLVPMLAGMLFSQILTTRVSAQIGTGVAIAIAVIALWIPAHDRDSSRMRPAVKSAWGDACWWVRTETPADALVLAADTRWAFKWFAQRPEYVNHKDCPQDPESIAEFRRRQRLLFDWSTAAIEDRIVSSDELADLQSQTGIDYMVTHRFGPIEMTPVYQNQFFRVYQLGTPSLPQ